MRGRFLSPLEVLRLPGEMVDGSRRAAANLARVAQELSALRRALERTEDDLDGSLETFRRDVPHIRRRVDEAVDSAPTKGPVQKARDTLSSG